MPEQPGAEEPSKLKRYLRLSTIGIEMGLSVMIGLVGGQWLDKYFGTAPYLLLVGLLFGMTAGILSIVRAVKSVNAMPKK